MAPDQPDKTPFEQDSVDVGLRKCLNSHGYGFHYRTLKRCVESAAFQPWKFAVAECPVTLRDTEIHVDFVLGSGPHLIVAECKRVEGWKWGFARSSDLSTSEYPRADYMEWETAGGRLFRRVQGFGPRYSPYDVSIEMKQRKCEVSDSRGAFNEALNQVLRARGGIIDALGEAHELRYGGGAVVPVIFTTAPLFVTSTMLKMADDSGHLPELQTTEQPWLWFDHNVSRSLRPRMSHASAPPSPLAPTKTELLRATVSRDSKRSVAIVNEKGIEGFLAELRSSVETHGDIGFLNGR